MRRTDFYARLSMAILVLAVLLVGVPAARAQEEPYTVQVVQVDTSRFPEIDVYVSVTDADGQPVKNLTEDDFELEEDGRDVRLRQVSRAGEQGSVTAVLVIDKSGSMDYAGKMEAAREAAIAFVDLMREGDATGVIAFDTEVTTVQPITEDVEELEEEIDKIETGTDTALYDALHEAMEELEDVEGRTAVIAVTDGMNTAGERTLEETLSLVEDEGISVYTIGLGDPSQGTGSYAGIDEQALRSIAEASSGVYWYAPDPDELSGLYELLSLRIQNEYKLTYRSPNDLRDGTNREVEVVVEAGEEETEVEAAYNPGGVIPEVEERSTWGLFLALLVLLVVLLVAPGAVANLRARSEEEARPRVRLRD